MQVFTIILLAVAVALLLVLLLKSRADLARSQKGERMKNAFLANISREIRVPLKVVVEMANVVSKEDLYLSKSEKHNIADQLTYNANLIGTLIDEVMLFSDVHVEGHPLKDDVFSPNALCRRCLEANMHSIYHCQAVRLTFKRELSDEYFVRTDRHVVELILNKLILNACRFTEQGEVVVGCNVSEHVGYLTFYVADTGVGIPKNRLNNLFTWFDTPDDMKDEAELDLSICHKLAEKLGGRVLLDELRQRGTRIMLLVPVK